MTGRRFNQWTKPAPYLESKNPVGEGTDGRKAENVTPQRGLFFLAPSAHAMPNCVTPYMTLGGTGRHPLVIRTRGEEIQQASPWASSEPRIERPVVVAEDTRHQARQALVLKAPSYRTWEWRDKDVKAEADKKRR
jgi:hypothetical protein